MVCVSRQAFWIEDESHPKRKYITNRFIRFKFVNRSDRIQGMDYSQATKKRDRGIFEELFLPLLWTLHFLLGKFDSNG